MKLYFNVTHFKQKLFIHFNNYLSQNMSCKFLLLNNWHFIFNLVLGEREKKNKSPLLHNIGHC